MNHKYNANNLCDKGFEEDRERTRRTCMSAEWTCHLALMNPAATLGVGWGGGSGVTLVEEGVR